LAEAVSEAEKQGKLVHSLVVGKAQPLDHGVAEAQKLLDWLQAQALAEPEFATELDTPEREECKRWAVASAR